MADLVAGGDWCCKATASSAQASRVGISRWRCHEVDLRTLLIRAARAGTAELGYMHHNRFGCLSKTVGFRTVVVSIS